MQVPFLPLFPRFPAVRLIRLRDLSNRSTDCHANKDVEPDVCKVAYSKVQVTTQKQVFEVFISLFDCRNTPSSHPTNNKKKNDFPSLPTIKSFDIFFTPSRCDRVRRDASEAVVVGPCEPLREDLSQQLRVVGCDTEKFYQ